MAKSPHFERASRSHSSMSLNLISVDRSSIALSVLLCGAIVADSGQRPRLLRARRERPRNRPAAKCSQQLPPSDGDCHAPLPCEVRKDNDTTPRARCPNCVAPGAGTSGIGLNGSPPEPRSGLLSTVVCFAPRLCSLIPGFGVKLSAIILAGPSVLSEVGSCPPHDGVRRRWWINVASAVSLIERARKK